MSNSVAPEWSDLTVDDCSGQNPPVSEGAVQSLSLSVCGGSLRCSLLTGLCNSPVFDFYYGISANVVPRDAAVKKLCSRSTRRSRWGNVRLPQGTTAALPEIEKNFRLFQLAGLPVDFR